MGDSLTISTYSIYPLLGANLIESMVDNFSGKIAAGGSFQSQLSKLYARQFITQKYGGDFSSSLR